MTDNNSDPVIKTTIDNPDSMEAYLDQDDPYMDSPRHDEEDAVDPTITEVQEKYNGLYERYVSLKAVTESLKDKISSEKQQLNKELKATLELQAQLKHECGDRLGVMSRKEYEKKMELFKDFVFFQQATESLESLKKKNYRSWLEEVERKCNSELLKIKESITKLQPLRDIANNWDKEKVGDGADVDASKLGDGKIVELECGRQAVSVGADGTS